MTDPMIGTRDLPGETLDEPVDRTGPPPSAETPMKPPEPPPTADRRDTTSRELGTKKGR